MNIDDRDRLEQQLEEAHGRIYELESQLKRDSLIRSELEELVREIHLACQSILHTEDKKLTLEEAMGNLSENIRKLAKDYNIQL
jgi:predicted metal-dependent hydrolase